MILFRSRLFRSPLVFTDLALEFLVAFRILTETTKICCRSTAYRALIDIYIKWLYTPYW
jgi:hypothetical protein